MQKDVVDLKTILKESVGTSTHADICRQIDDILRMEPGISIYSFLDRCCASAAERLSLPAKKVALLSSFTLEPIVGFLRVELFRKGFRLLAECFPYKQWQEELAGNGRLRSFEPSDVILFFHPEDILPVNSKQFLSSRPEDRSQELEEFLGTLKSLLTKYRKSGRANLVFGTLPQCRREAERFFGISGKNNRRVDLEFCNQRIADWTKEIPAFYLFPYAACVEDFGRVRFFDPIKNNSTQTAIASGAYPFLARELAKYLYNLWVPRHKCIVLDLDNTLWGGVVGEDGIEGIELGLEGKGKGFRDWQLFLRELRATGVLLALNSKNNLNDAKEVFDKHPNSALKWDDFASIAVNWTDKSENLRAIAEELNLGLSSFVFVDDNPMECDRVRSELPEVTVMQADGPPEFWPDRLMDCAALEPMSLSSEDLQRNESYTAERSRKELQIQFSDFGQFLKSLDLELDVLQAKKTDLLRLSQLAGKTNQFNTTTIRYTQQELEERLKAEEHLIASLALRDKYGDYGTIGMIVLRDSLNHWHIENYLMSCRVLGRKVEETVIALLQKYTVQSGRKGLIGYYRPTAKNALVSDLYPRYGLKPYSGRLLGSLSEQNPGAWIWDASLPAVQLPDTIKLRSDLL